MVIPITTQIIPSCLWPGIKTGIKINKGSNMKFLDEEDISILDSLDCFKKITIKNGHGANYAPYIGYRLINLAWKKRFMNFLKPYKVEEETSYIFIIGTKDNYGWYKSESNKKVELDERGWCFHHDDNWKISFEEVFEDIPENLKCKLIYHLDIFNPK